MRAPVKRVVFEGGVLYTSALSGTTRQKAPPQPTQERGAASKTPGFPMRLSKLKLAGFKSFVDPTTVHLPSNLTGVVGPNGCGKSNVIDAVRWVMGEISAKHLRGNDMTDVIFNGSGGRKPVGAASVELVFDNADGTISAAPTRAYDEVSLKRQVGRDGPSTYYINGARCRRKDITQLFLGTGLGSRSLRDHRAGHDLAPHRGQARRHARLPRGGGRHLEVQGAAQGDREPHRAHAREPRPPERPPRRARQADPPPAAPGRDRAPLPGPQGGGAQAPRRAPCPASSRTSTPRPVARAGSARERDVALAGGGRGAEVRRGRDREGPRPPRARDRGARGHPGAHLPGRRRGRALRAGDPARPRAPGPPARRPRAGRVEPRRGGDAARARRAGADDADRRARGAGARARRGARPRGDRRRCARAPPSRR